MFVHYLTFLTTLLNLNVKRNIRQLFEILRSCSESFIDFILYLLLSLWTSYYEIDICFTFITCKPVKDNPKFKWTTLYWIGRIILARVSWLCYCFAMSRLNLQIKKVQLVYVFSLRLKGQYHKLIDTIIWQKSEIWHEQVYISNTTLLHCYNTHVNTVVCGIQYTMVCTIHLLTKVARFITSSGQ